MNKHLLVQKLTLTFVILTFLVLLVYAMHRSIDQEIETTLINPIQIQSYGDCVYFLDMDEPTNKIKKYENGKIYDAVPWLPKTFFKPKQYIMGFDVINEHKLVILTKKYQEQPVEEFEDPSQKTEYSFYLLDGKTKKAVQITSMMGIGAPDSYGQGQAFFDLDQDNNIYISCYEELLKVTPNGENIVLASIETLPPDIGKDKIDFAHSAVGPNSLFTILSEESYNSVLIEMDKEGNFIKSHDLDYAKSDAQFENTGKSLRFVKFYDGVIFIENYYELYKYDLTTESLTKIFDEPLGEVHKWDVVDMAQTDDGYLLLVTDSDTGNCVFVWKLTDDNVLQMDYLSTSNTL